MPDTLEESQPAHAALGQVGSTVDRYTVVRRLGAGGMGEVFEAVDPKLQRHVALKLLKPAPGEGTTDRLLGEARAMAKVSHPNVVAVFDAGLAGGQPWVAMELVRGTTLREWMRSSHPWTRTLRVLCEAGRGVWAAHEAGLVHRDLKPENVLVGEGGRVAVSDFGLAFAAWSPPVPSVVTPAVEAGGAGVLAGTPGYMSPEQLARGPTDARTDQFAFAVTAYEALYGALPFAVAPGEPVRGPPQPPAAGPVPARVFRALERALSVRPEERFPSMAQLVQELEAALPKRRGWVVAAVGAAAICAAGGTYAATRPPSCEGGPKLLASAWNEARKAQVQAALGSSPLPLGAVVAPQLAQRLDAYGSAWVAMHREACLATREGHQSAALLDLRNDCLRRRLDDLDALAGRLARDGSTLAAEAERAVDGLAPVTSCAASASLLERLPVPPPQAQAVASLDRGLSQVKAMEDLGQYRDALEPAKAQLAEARKVAYPPALAEALVELGRIQDLSGASRDAVPTYDEAVNTAEVARDDQLRARARMRRVHLLINLHQLDDAERELKAAAAVVERVGDKAMAQELVGLQADLATAQGKLDQAVALAKDALNIVEGLSPPDERRLVSALGTYAWSLFRLGKFQDAGKVYERSIPLAERVLGPKNPGLAVLTGVYSKVLGRQHRMDDARKWHQKTVDIIAASLGPDSLMMGTDLGDWGMILLVSHQVDEAKPALEKALEIKKKLVPPDDASLATPVNGLAVIAAMTGHHDEAAARFKECLAIREKALGPTHPRVLGDLNDLAEAYSMGGRHAEALAVLDDALAREEKAPPGARMSDSMKARVRMGRGEELIALGRRAEAKAELAKSHELALKSEEPDLRSRQRVLEAELAWDGAGDAAAALALAKAARPDLELSKDPEALKNLDELVQRVKAGKRKK